MGFTLWYIGQEPDVQRKVHDELDAVFGELKLFQQKTLHLWRNYYRVPKRATFERLVKHNHYRSAHPIWQGFLLIAFEKITIYLC